MQEWKASEKEAQKMTRDGAISVNLVTGEATHISDRPPEQDYSSADDTAETSGRVVDEMEAMWNGARRKKRGTSGATPSGRGRRPGTALPPVCSLQRRNGRCRN